MNKTILFYDAVCPKPYILETLALESLGGTEATVLRVAEGLANKGHKVTIEQRNRESIEVDPNFVGIEYNKLNSTLASDPNAVITLRDAGHYITNKARFPQAKHYLWLHDVVSGDYRDHLLHHLENQEANIVVVSEWHKQQVINALMPIITSGRIWVTRVYNPLATYCQRQRLSVYDPRKLIFMSSPHKGLDYVLKVFEELIKVDPEFKLYVANPGYYRDYEGNLPKGVYSLGSMTHKQLMEEVRTSLCMFYPQISFEETFGLVYAESNAVGTPVLCHAIGAAPEVLEHRGQLVDCRSIDAVVNKVLEWYNGGRLILRGNSQFELNNVINHWEKLI